MLHLWALVCLKRRKGEGEEVKEEGGGVEGEEEEGEEEEGG